MVAQAYVRIRTPTDDRACRTHQHQASTPAVGQLSFCRSPDVHTALLVAVVGACGPVVEALVDEVPGELGELLLAQLVVEATLHGRDGLLA
eukprot:scaffold87101_cov63-Phaeocystis_antarctica.AAC.1